MLDSPVMTVISSSVSFPIAFKCAITDHSSHWLKEWSPRYSSVCRHFDVTHAVGDVKPRGQKMFRRAVCSLLVLEHFSFRCFGGIYY